MRTVLASLVLLSLLLMAGCYETPFAIGRVEDAKVDPSLLGEWSFDSLGQDANERAVLAVARRDDHQYALEWRTNGKTIKFTGFVAEVKGAKFVQFTPVDGPAAAAKTHYLMRFDLDGADTLALSNLDGGFLATRAIDSDAKLRAEIEANLDNALLYEPDVMLGTRVKAK